jgi:hypothetical protein
MGRPIYAHELTDPDFTWLISSFKESHPEYTMLESTLLPIVLINKEAATAVDQLRALIPMPTSIPPAIVDEKSKTPIR